MRRYSVAILGATGEVGRTLLKILEQRRFPVGELQLLASNRSAGTEMEFGGRKLTVQDVETVDFSATDIGFFSAGGSVSERHAPRAAASGCLVIDNTSRFRHEPDVPLIVPEVNPECIAASERRNIIANPNCSTIQMVLALKPIYDAVGIRRIQIASYQAVSGAGARAIEELRAQARAVLSGEPGQAAAQVFPVPIAFNALPQIGDFEANGYTEEEMKMVRETQRIFDDQTLAIHPTCVRVPVFCGHSEAVSIETTEPIEVAAVRALLRDAPGLQLMDDAVPGGYPTAAVQGAGQDPVWVGRIRRDLSHPLGIAMWIVADNLRKGAALNSVQIAELWASRRS